jgi:hypothetical protein
MSPVRNCLFSIFTATLRSWRPSLHAQPEEAPFCGGSGKPKVKRLLERPRRRWVDNIKMDLLEIGWGRVDWIGLAQGRDKWRALLNSVMNHRVP